MNKTKVLRILPLLVLFAAGTTCFQKKGDYESPQGYNLNKPEIFKMPEYLKEISGIAFHHGKSDTIYAEEDEHGKLYYFSLGDKEMNYSKFAKHGDYEDIAICNEQVILLRSDGVLFTFPFNEARNEKVADVHEWTNILPEGEYEGLCADDKTNELYILCKHCSDDKTGKRVSGYIFQLTPNGTITKSGNFGIDVKMIEKLSNSGKIHFHPSGLARNPLTREWFIISSFNRILVITDQDWKIEKVYTLNPEIFNKPEGIAFDAGNNLYISNEKGEMNNATILKFSYQKH